MTAATGAFPPGPRLPRLVQTLGFIFAPPRFIDACHRRYGDVVTFSTAFDSRFVMVFDPDLVKQVFQAPPDRLRAGEANALLGPMLGERSVLLLDGAEHLRQRKLMLPPFHGKRLQAYEEVMRAAADRAIDGWPVGEEFALLPSMQSLTLDVIVRTIFGVDPGARSEELKRRVRAAIDPVSQRIGVMVLLLSRGRFGDRGAMRRFEERRGALDELIYEEIDRRRAAPDLEEREDVFSMLLGARDEDGEAMTDQELRDELVTLLVAGHETTATGLAWAFDLLLHHPRALDRLREENGEVPRRGGQGDAAGAPGHPGHRARRARRAVRARRLPHPARRRDQPVDRDHAPPRRPLPAAARVPPRALPRGPTRPTPTRGSPSAAARAAAWARASPSSRCAS